MSSDPSSSRRYRPAPTFDRLGEGFFDVVEPARFPEARLRFRNQRWAERVGLDGLGDEAWRRHFARFEPLAGNLCKPFALRYHGHQFMIYNPSLGDGRGFLFAQLRDAEDGRLLDLATKGSGRTPWSRGGDGRLTLKGGVREVLATEMLEALGVYTSKSFSLIETGEALFRDDEPSPARSAVLVRLSHSHIRFGTFQRHAAERRNDRVRRLLDHAVEHAMPDLLCHSSSERVSAFFDRVVENTATLAASWTAAGFVHGVLNTDNMNVTGESFDYGPYRFLPVYDPAFVAAYFDHGGLYAFGRQPTMLAWNLQQLAASLAGVGDLGEMERSLDAFWPVYERQLRERLLARLGLEPREPELDQLLVESIRAFLETTSIAFEQFFFDWFGGLASGPRVSRSPARELYEHESFALVRERLRGYVSDRLESSLHPYFGRMRPCTLLIDEIETIWSAIAERDDWEPFYSKLREISLLREALAPLEQRA